jgi:hypothetical protein
VVNEVTREIERLVWVCSTWAFEDGDGISIGRPVWKSARDLAGGMVAAEKYLIPE